MAGQTDPGRGPRIRLAALCLLAGLAGAATARSANEIEVVASKAGFRPPLLRLRKGETVRLLLRTADQEHCFAVDAFRVEKRIVPGQTTLLELSPDRAGSFPFYCCLDPDREAERGKLVVGE